MARAREKYTMHIEFADGSNPYLKNNMSRRTYIEELKKWQKNYILKTQSIKNGINGSWLLFFKATEKGKEETQNHEDEEWIRAQNSSLVD